MRDYSAHFFRWSFARRLIGEHDAVLDVGCGVETPLMKVLTVGVGGRRCRTYTGVDLNVLPHTEAKGVRLFGGFDFVERWRDVGDWYDVVACLETIEHMPADAGWKAIRAMHKVARPGGRLIISTPVYNGVYHAANHVHEWEDEELRDAVTSAGFRVEREYGCHMDLRKVGRDRSFGSPFANSVNAVARALREYFDDDALSCILAPLHPSASRNKLWLCTKN